MAIVVPISKPQPSSLLGSSGVPPPSDSFALMAAAQIHSEGRLIQSDSDPTIKTKSDGTKARSGK